MTQKVHSHKVTCPDGKVRAARKYTKQSAAMSVLVYDEDGHRTRVTGVTDRQNRFWPRIGTKNAFVMPHKAIARTVEVRCPDGIMRVADPVSTVNGTVRVRYQGKSVTGVVDVQGRFIPDADGKNGHAFDYTDWTY